LLDGHSPMTCFWQRIKRRTKQNNRVGRSRTSRSDPAANNIGFLEAALDANAPLEDDDETNAGPVDSDEETAAVMGSLALWNPQPLVPQPVLSPIKRQYQLARLHEQLQMATNGGRTNIFKVVGYGRQRLADGHPSLLGDFEDAPGEPDSGIIGFSLSRGSSSFGLQPSPQRRPSVTTRA